ncbi:hypothetical protein B1B_15903 [mine drainage metagenome]|uniref:Uncharacterized protein n=1 Tax=mine drainage metagenome TaxID=410659 RepID=T0YRT7_9ZZZZ
MSDSKIAPIAARLLSTVSGTISININGRQFSKISFVDSGLEVNLLNEKSTTSVMGLVPKQARKLSLLNKVSRLLAWYGVSVRLTDSKGELMFIGYKAHSILGGVKVKFLRMRKYLK